MKTRTSLFTGPLINVRELIYYGKELGPLALALGLNICLDKGFFEAIRFILKAVLLSLSLNIIYNWIYVINEFVVKYEPPELRTFRFHKEITLRDVIISFLARINLTHALLYFSVCMRILSFYEYYQNLYLGIILIVLMVLHQVLSWEMRSLTTLPLLRIFRILYVFLPITTNVLEKYWVLIYAFTTNIPHILNYFGSKLIRTTLKVREHTIIFSRKTYTFAKNVLHISIMFSAFSAVMPLVFHDLEPLKLIIYLISMIISIITINILGRVLRNLNIFGGLLK
jgi:hypothetical protein